LPLLPAGRPPARALVHDAWAPPGSGDFREAWTRHEAVGRGELFSELIARFHVDHFPAGDLSTVSHIGIFDGVVAVQPYVAGHPAAAYSQLQFSGLHRNRYGHDSCFGCLLSLLFLMSCHTSRFQKPGTEKIEVNAGVPGIRPFYVACDLVEKDGHFSFV